MGDEVDIEQLISLVEARPVIWDITDEKYKDRNKTFQGWREILIELRSDFEELGNREKDRFGKDVIKKWTNIRDSFRKSRKKNSESAKYGAEPKKFKSYIYDSQLQFLNKVFEKRYPEDSPSTKVEQPETVDEDEGESRDTAVHTPPPKIAAHHDFRRKIQKKRKFEPVDLRSEMIKRMRDKPNRHQSFFNGIMPSLENFDDLDVIEFQLGVLKTIHSIKQRKHLVYSNVSRIEADTKPHMGGQAGTSGAARHDTNFPQSSTSLDTLTLASSSGRAVTCQPAICTVQSVYSTLSGSEEVPRLVASCVHRPSSSDSSSNDEAFDFSRKNLSCVQGNVVVVKEEEESDDDAEYQQALQLPKPSSSANSLVIEQNYSLQQPETLIYAPLDDQIDEKCTESITKFLATSMQSYSLVEEESFKEMIRTLNPWYSLPGRKYFSHIAIPRLYNEAADRLKEILPNSVETRFSVTCDCWTSGSSHSYMATTVHYINTNWKLISACLNGAYFEENYTAENVKDVIKNKLEEWDLNLNSIISCTTDNGPNSVKAVELLNLSHVPCFAHSINVGINRAIEVPQVRMAVMILNSLQNAIAHSLEMRKSLGDAQGLLHDDVKNLPSACNTRWWSTLKLCKRFLENRLSLTKMLQNFPEKQHLKPEDADISALENFVEVTSVLQDVTENVTSENYVTSSAVLPLIRQIKKKLKAEESDTVLLKNLKKNIFGALLCYEKEPVQTVLRFSTFVDPRFRLYFFDDDVKAVVEEAIINELTDLYNSSEPSVLSDTCHSPLKKKRKGLSALLEEEESQEVSNPRQRSAKEVEKYLCMTKIDLDDNPLQWWQEYEQYFPKLAVIAKKYLCIQGSSVPFEKVFSTRGDVIEKKRRSLSPKNADKQIFLAFNKHIFDI